MALQKDFEFNGLVIEGAYFKVTSADVTKERIIANLSVYQNKIKAEENEGALQTLTYVVQHNTNDTAYNVIKQVYDYLKSTNEYSDSLDA